MSLRCPLPSCNRVLANPAPCLACGTNFHKNCLPNHVLTCSKQLSSVANPHFSSNNSQSTQQTMSRDLSQRRTQPPNPPVHGLEQLTLETVARP